MNHKGLIVITVIYLFLLYKYKKENEIKISLMYFEKKNLQYILKLAQLFFIIFYLVLKLHKY